MAVIIRIEEPDLFFSFKDEDHFFEWLKSIDGVTKVIGDEDGLEVTLQRLKKESLMELIALLTRYSVDKRCLAPLCNSQNKKWFKDKTKYWYASIFERPQKRKVSALKRRKKMLE